MKTENVYLTIGGNIEDRIQYLNSTKGLINKHLGEIQQTSSIYETPPWGFEAENDFLNQALIIKSKLDAKSLIEKIMRIEEKLGRVRSGDHYTSRTVDIDIIFYGNSTINSKHLQIPHPKMHLRNFVLLPLNEIAPKFTHPLYNKTIESLTKECQDESICYKTNL